MMITTTEVHFGVFNLVRAACPCGESVEVEYDRHDDYGAERAHAILEARHRDHVDNCDDCLAIAAGGYSPCPWCGAHFPAEDQFCDCGAVRASFRNCRRSRRPKAEGGA